MAVYLKEQTGTEIFQLVVVIDITFFARILSFSKLSIGAERK